MFKKTISGLGDLEAFGKGTLTEIANDLAEVLLNDIPENSDVQTVTKYIEAKLPGFKKLLTSKKALEDFKQMVCDFILKKRENQQKLTIGGNLIDSIYGDLKNQAQAVIHFTEPAIVDLEKDLENYLKKTLGSYYTEPVLQERIGKLSEDLKAEVISQKKGASIELIFSEADIRQRVEREFQTYLTDVPKKGSLATLFVTASSLGMLSGLASIGTKIFNVVTSGTLTILNAIPSFIQTFAVEDLVLISICFIIALKSYNYLVDAATNQQDYKKSAERMMKDFTQEKNFQIMIDCLDQKKYDTVERFFYKKAMYSLIKKSLNIYSSANTLLQKIQKLLVSKKLNKLSRLNKIKFLINSISNNDYRFPLREIINRNNISPGKKKKLLLEKIAEIISFDCFNHLDHLKNIRDIFEVCFVKDKRAYPFRKRLEKAFDKILPQLLNGKGKDGASTGNTTPPKNP